MHGPAILLGLVLAARMARRLPLLPEPTGDSQAYLDQAAYRPPLYGWLLQAWQTLAGGLQHLPLLQLLLLVAAVVVFAVALGQLLRRRWVPPVVVLGVLAHPAVHDSPRTLMTEALFLVCVLASLAALCRYAARPGLLPLLLGAACAGLATLARSTGLIMVLLPVLLALFDARYPLRFAWRRAAAAALVAAAVLVGGMGWTWQRHGHFELGSWTGISLLGKALLLAQPEDLAALPPPVAAAMPVIERSRALLAAQPDLPTRLRAQVQVSGDMRFVAFWPAAEALWPAWQAADDREKGRLAMALDRQLIAAHPGAYLNLVAHDWLSLVLHPAYWPRWASAEVAEPHAFALCRERDNCWALMRFDLPWPGVLALFAASLPGTLAALVLALVLLPVVLRRRASPAMVLAWGVALLVHGTLLGSAAFEYGITRYTVGLHVLDLTLLLWLATACQAPWRRRR